MKTKKALGIIAMMFIIAISSGLFADTIIDSVYADPILDGIIHFSQNTQSLEVNNWMYDMGAGDAGESLMASDPNSYSRSYISFELPDIPEDYVLDSVYVRIYQYRSVGDGDIIGNQEPYPLFYGQELPCIMDHIDYGYQLDPLDWTKGDPGDPGTLHTNIGIISDSAEVGYRYLDITRYVREDYHNERDKTQYRIRFPIETDWDYLYDNLGFFTSFQYPEHDPVIFLYFTSVVGIDNDFNSPISNNISVYPNPFSTSTTISFSLNYRDKESIELKIYNIKGQLVKKCEVSLHVGKKCEMNEVVWDGKDENNNVVSNGLYLIRIGNNKFNVVEKIVKLRNNE